MACGGCSADGECADVFGACANDPACAMIVMCASGPNCNFDVTCTEQCVMDNPDGEEAWDAFVFCQTCTACPMACAGVIETLGLQC